MHRKLFALILGFLVVLPLSAQNSETGYASWYNRGFNGLATASGEAYDHEGLTAAHPTLPFGSMIRVTRVDDGRSVLVRVNDRMKSGPGHVIDLSGAAARAIGMMDSGVARVRLDQQAGQAVATVTPASETIAPQRGSYTLQLGVFSNRPAAEAEAGKHEAAWIQTISSANGTMYRVYYSGFDNEEAARSAQRRLSSHGFDSFLRTLQ
ncbi:MAG: septal ring lytic transglycosylase RlpA family protein [Rhodothermales bacterium]|nr:septal ring lytic transglycosylase RlpA family protein [Rhodothermales bacterium]MBO6780220.1 septal ring lytic transglycosylase RlpA family protein [Rhodothermales bacterium]